MKDELSSRELGEERSFKDGFLKELLSGHLIVVLIVGSSFRQSFPSFSSQISLDIYSEKSEKSHLNLLLKIKD